MPPPTLQILLRQLSLSRYRPVFILGFILTTIFFIISIGSDSTQIAASAEEETSRLRSALSLSERTGDFPPLLPEEDPANDQKTFDDSGDEDDKFLADTLNDGKDNFDFAKALRDINLENSDDDQAVANEIEKRIVSANSSSNSTQLLLSEPVVLDKNGSEQEVVNIKADEESDGLSAKVVNVDEGREIEDVDGTTIQSDETTTISRLNLLPIKELEIISSQELEKRERKVKRRQDRLEHLRRLNQSLVIL